MIKLTGIIDIGTNTVKLLVIRNTEDDTPLFVHKRIFPTKTGQGSFGQNRITDAAAERTLEALKKAVTLAKGYECTTLKAFATAALRNADNSTELTNRVREELGLDIEIISGNREAELIYYGVKNAVKLGAQPVLIMDIGGGSTEYIIADENQILYKHSYNHGVGTLLEKFEIPGKIRPIDRENIKFYIYETTRNLQEALARFPCQHIIGCSGSFKTFYQIIKSGEHLEDEPEVKKEPVAYPFDERFPETLKKLIASDESERLLTPGIPEMRVDTIHIAALLTKTTIENLNLKSYSYSSYSMVEGVWFEETLNSEQ